MRDDAILTAVGVGGGDHDHFAFGLAQTAFALHQGVVIGEKRAEFIRAVRQGQEHVGHESGLFLHGQDRILDVGG